MRLGERDREREFVLILFGLASKGFSGTTDGLYQAIEESFLYTRRS